VVLIANLVGVLNGPTMAMITIRGRGIDRNLNIQAMPTFPPTFRNPGDMAPVRALTVHNNGEALLRISALMIAGDPVWRLVDSAPVDIAGAASHDFMITFSPTTIGPAPAGQLTLVNNDNNRPVVMVALTGTGVGRNVTFGPEAPELPAIDLGYTGVGIPITADDILAVTSKDPAVGFTIHMIQLDGDGAFRVDDAPANAALPASGVKRFAITFAPTAVGDFQTRATLYLDQDPQPQAEVTLTGHAVFVDATGSGGCDAGRTGRGGLIVGLAALGCWGAVVELGERSPLSQWSPRCSRPDRRFAPTASASRSSNRRRRRPAPGSRCNRRTSVSTAAGLRARPCRTRRIRSCSMRALLMARSSTTTR
jgi:hypothetical protein